ncbi:hypothetical protein [Hydrogenimonas sp.]
MKKIGAMSIVCLMAFLFNGCIPANNRADALTVEQKKQLLQALMNRMQQAPDNGGSKGLLQQQEAQKGADPISEEELLSKIKAYPKPATGIHFEQRADGLEINGQKIYVDYEGSITRYGYDWQSGNMVYIVELSPGAYKIKYQRALSGKEPTDIASVYRNGSILSIRTVTGKRFSGKAVIPTSSGFIVTRDKTAFIYEIGHAPFTFNTPDGWHIATFQNGDVATTGFILLERDAEVTSSTNPFTQLLNSTKELGNAIGITEKKDYMLISLKNPSLHRLINITLGEKEVALYSQCRQKNSYVNICDTMNMKQSLFEPNGLKNANHYFWNIHWFKGKEKIFSVTKESNNKKVLIADLEHNRSVEGAYRVTGFPEYTTSQDEKGIVKVHVEGGLLPSVEIPDAEKLLNKT